MALYCMAMVVTNNNFGSSCVRSAIKFIYDVGLEPLVGGVITVFADLTSQHVVIIVSGSAIGTGQACYRAKRRIITPGF